MIVKVETLKEWNDVVSLALSRGFTWFNFNESYRDKVNSDIFPYHNAHGRNPLYITLNNGNIFARAFIENGEESVTTAEYLNSYIYTVSQKDYERLNLIKNHADGTLLSYIGEHWVWLQNLQAIGTKALLKWFADDEHIKIVPESAKYVLWTKDDNGRTVYYNTIHGVPTFDREQKNAVKFDTEEQAEQAANDFWTVGEYNG